MGFEAEGDDWHHNEEHRNNSNHLKYLKNSKTISIIGNQYFSWKIYKSM